MVQCRERRSWGSVAAEAREPGEAGTGNSYRCSRSLWVLGGHTPRAFEIKHVPERLAA